MSARLAREDTGAARASGYVADDQEDEWDDEDGLSQLDTALHQQSSAWWEDPISGCPSTLEETCMTLLDSCTFCLSYASHSSVQTKSRKAWYILTYNPPSSFLPILQP